MTGRCRSTVMGGIWTSPMMILAARLVLAIHSEALLRLLPGKARECRWDRGGWVLDEVSPAGLAPSVNRDAGQFSCL